MPPIITVEHVYKQYQMFSGMKLRTLTQEIGKVLRVGKTALQRRERPQQRYVLNDIHFSLNSGESLGIIGHNGSGKTTLLRLLAGVSLPTKGRVRVVGRVSPLLALGAGFHPDMTGYENLYLNCTLMGLNYQQTRSRIDQITDFADIGDYIDVPVKRYSSGMMARLGFAAAIHMDPEVILVDEVLAVGDYSFVVKSMAAIRRFMEQGTVILVSHDLESLERLCTNTLWLDHGQMRAIGPSVEIVQQYTHAQQQQIAAQAAAAEAVAEPDAPVTGAADNYRVAKEQFDPNVTIHAVSTHNFAGEPQREFGIPDEIVIRAQISFAYPMTDIRIVAGLVDIATNTIVTCADNQQVDQPDVYSGHLTIEVRLPNLYLRPRGFGVYIGISNPVALMPLAAWTDLQERLFVIGERRDPAFHYYAPQADIVFTPGASMQYLTVNESTLSAG